MSVFHSGRPSLLASIVARSRADADAAGPCPVFEERPVLKKRKITTKDGSEKDPQGEHYGVPIYDLLREVNSEPKERKPPAIKTISTNVLFTEKYTPKKYTDLEGFQDSQRIILRWLSNWQSIVFGYAPRVSDFTDSFGRPLKKILLVHGPPGVGKTTAVRVMAQTQGFDCLEINASDDRGASAVQERISSALFSHQATSKRPVCVIADEVDGAEGGFIRVLIDLIKADSRRTSASEGSKNKKKKDRLLQRPIVCICNDAFTRTLHDLRQYCEVVYYPPPPSNRLLKRLQDICYEEKLEVASKVLSHDLAETGGDFRACLNRLQFGGSRDMAGKDGGKSLAGLSTRIFSKESSDIVGEIEAFEEPVRLLEHCFEQYPQAHYNDDRLQKPCEMSEWYALSDYKWWSAQGDYAAMGAQAFHTYFSSLSNDSLKYRRPQQVFPERKKNASIIDQVRSKARLPVKREFSAAALREELVPYAWQLACPEINNVPNDQDKAKIRSCCESLKDIGLALSTQRLENGAVVHQLYPIIDSVCVLSKEDAEFAANGKYVARTLLRKMFDEMTREVVAGPQAKIPEPQKKAPRARTGLFGEALTQGASQQDANVWISYKEGLSNAVRKRVGWNDLFK